MSIKFNPINKYAVAVMFPDDLMMRLITQVHTGPDKYHYQASARGELDDDICTVDSLDQLVVMLDDIQNPRQIYGSAGEKLGEFQLYDLMPVTLTVTMEDCSREIAEANFSLKRIKALSKLTNEDKLVLGIE